MEKRVIRLSYSGFTDSFKYLFPESDVEVITPNDSEMDMLLFVGGEDVNPAMYGDRNRNSAYNDTRDKYEAELWNKAMRGEIETKKILGVCRGNQFVNVMQGGSLYQDMKDEFGMSHESVHGIEWKTEIPILGEIKLVNSLHHQAIRYYGEDMRCRILGKEPRTGVIEALCWANRYLGIQFHPEYIDEKHPTHQLFRKAIYEWIDGNLDLYNCTYENKAELEKERRKSEAAAKRRAKANAKRMKDAAENMKRQAEMLNADVDKMPAYEWINALREDGDVVEYVARAEFGDD